MKTLDIIFVILIVFLLIISILVVLYKNLNDKLKNILNDLYSASNDYYDKLNTKYELLISFIDNVKDKYKIDNKIFNEVRILKKEELSSLSSEKLLNKCFNLLVQIKDDNQKKKELKIFKDIIDKYNDNELYVVALRTYYNKNILEYNNLIKKFPYNIISKIKKYDFKNILEGKEIVNVFTNEVEV